MEQEQKKFEEVTLYNFTSMRSPQNREKDDEDMKIDFIYCDIIEKSKIQKDVDSINNSENYTDFDQLLQNEEISKIIEIGKKINEYRYKEINFYAIHKSLDKVSDDKHCIIEIKQIVWKALVKVTKNGGELKFKEALINILRVFHLKKHKELISYADYKKDIPVFNRLINAQVVIPKELFPKEETFFWGEKYKQYQIDKSIIKRVSLNQEISKYSYYLEYLDLSDELKTNIKSKLDRKIGAKEATISNYQETDIFKTIFYGCILISKEKGIFLLNFDEFYFEKAKSIISATISIENIEINSKNNSVSNSELLFDLNPDLISKLIVLEKKEIQIKIHLNLKDENHYDFELILTKQKQSEDKINIIEYCDCKEIILDDGEDYFGQTFAPSGYGVKQLGILEYRRVVSTISRYVPAEVSKIENVMASEYKELATVKELTKEVTDFESTEASNEKENETVSTDRFQMQSEISKIFEDQQKTNFDTKASYGADSTKLEISYGTSVVDSKTESNKQAITNAKEVTNKAVERIFTKVRKERTVKITEKFTESNKHGFDNRGNDKHVSGVYRHINAVYRNQIQNYGRRLLYEFAIPEPALFHRLAIDNQIDWVEKLEKIKRPNNPKDYLKDFTEITQESQLKIEALSGIKFDDIILIQPEKHLFNEYGGGGTQTPTINYNIPDGYELNSYSIVFDPVPNGWNYAGAVEFMTKAGDTPTFNIFIENINISSTVYTGTDMILPSTLYKTDVQIRIPNTGLFSVKVIAHQVEKFYVNILATYKITNASYSNWQRKQYEKIIDKYNIDFDNYKKEVAKLFEDNPIIDKYQETDKEYIQHISLRKQCISYIISDDPNNKNRLMGQNMYDPSTRNDLKKLKVLMNSRLNEYTAFARFLEQAFDWNMMSYSYYPFYWADKEEWKLMYNLYDEVPEFKKFLQAGMARVIVSVRPGFEKAVMQYMLTGKIWEGGDVPTYGSAMFLSIAAEINEDPNYTIEDTWDTVLPTNLIALQSSGVAINQEGLPNLEKSQDLGEMVEASSKFPKRKKFLGLF